VRDSEYFACTQRFCMLGHYHQDERKTGEGKKGATKRLAEKAAAQAAQAGEPPPPEKRVRYVWCHEPVCNDPLHFHTLAQAGDLARERMPMEVKVVKLMDTADRLPKSRLAITPDREVEHLVEAKENNSKPVSEFLASTPAPTERKEEKEHKAEPSELRSVPHYTSSTSAAVTPSAHPSALVRGEPTPHTSTGLGNYGNRVAYPRDADVVVVTNEIAFDLESDSTLWQACRNFVLRHTTHAVDGRKDQRWLSLTDMPRKFGRTGWKFKGGKRKPLNLTDGVYSGTHTAPMWRAVLTFLDVEASSKRALTGGKCNVNTLNHCKETVKRISHYAALTQLCHIDGDGVKWTGTHLVDFAIMYWMQHHYNRGLMVHAALNQAGVPKNLVFGESTASST
jgi:hypothetical protein